MSYSCGIDIGVAVLLGTQPCEPHIWCDKCGTERGVTKPSGRPYGWFLDGKAAPGWKIVRDEDTRLDFCPDCKATP